MRKDTQKDKRLKKKRQEKCNSKKLQETIDFEIKKQKKNVNFFVVIRNEKFELQNAMIL